MLSQMAKFPFFSRLLWLFVIFCCPIWALLMARQVKNLLTMQETQEFRTNFRIVCSISVENAIRILLGIASKLQIALGSMDILTILILSMHEHRVFFHIFMSSSTSFINVL